MSKKSEKKVKAADTDTNYEVGSVLMTEQPGRKNPVIIYKQFDDGFGLADETNTALNTHATAAMLKEHGYAVQAKVDVSDLEVKEPKHKLVVEETVTGGAGVMRVTKESASEDMPFPKCKACGDTGKDSKGNPCICQTAAVSAKARKALKETGHVKGAAKPAKVKATTTLIDEAVSKAGYALGKDIEESWEWKDFICTGLFEYGKVKDAKRIKKLMDDLATTAAENGWKIVKADDNHIRIK